MSPRFAAGTAVEVFYRMERDGEGYFPVPNQAARCLKPRFGMTDGGSFHAEDGASVAHMKSRIDGSVMAIPAKKSDEATRTS